MGGLECQELGFVWRSMGTHGWFSSRAVFRFSCMTRVCCSCDVTAVRSLTDCCPHHVCTRTYPQEHTRCVVFSIPVTLRLSPRSLVSLAATSEWRTSRAVTVGRWQGLVASRLSACFLAWKSLVWVQRRWRYWQRGRREGERLLACRERREKALPTTAPWKAWSVILANGASTLWGAPHVLWLLQIAEVRASPLLCLALSFLHVANSYLLGWAGDGAKREGTGTILMGVANRSSVGFGLWVRQPLEPPSGLHHVELHLSLWPS